MTIEEINAINAILDIHRKITNGYTGCKIEILNTKHNVINAIPTQSDYMHSITIFYEE